MKKLENCAEVKPIDLVSTLNAVMGFSDVEQGWQTMSEELWGLENELYVPIGKLSLPIEWKVYESEENSEGKITLYKGLLTVFNNRFFEDPKNMYVEPAPHIDLTELDENFFSSTLRAVHDPSPTDISRTVIIETRGTGDAYDLLIRQHIPAFLKLYDQIKGIPATTESLQCIRKAFTDYRR